MDVIPQIHGITKTGSFNALAARYRLVLEVAEITFFIGCVGIALLGLEELNQRLFSSA